MYFSWDLAAMEKTQIYTMSTWKKQEFFLKIYTLSEIYCSYYVQSLACKVVVHFFNILQVEELKYGIIFFTPLTRPTKVLLLRLLK
jgi:hypothetical protein